MSERVSTLPPDRLWQPTTAKRTQRVGYLALILVAAHLVVLGLKGWMAPAKWTSGLPPISLLAFVAAVIPLLVKRKLVKEKRERDQKTDPKPT